MTNCCLIALGSNLLSQVGGVDATLTYALGLLGNGQLKLVAQSRFFRTPAFPLGSGPDFLNAVAKVSTLLAPDQVIQRLHEIENSLGRERMKRWAPRVIDLDLLAYGDATLPSEKVFNQWKNLPLADQKTRAPDQLILPHPRLHERAFVLVPMLDVAPDWHHPVLRKTVRAMVADLSPEDIGDIVPLAAVPGQ